MEMLIKELCRTFLQQLPNGLCLIFAIGAVVCLVFTLPKRRHHNPLYGAFWLALLLMVLWRMVIGLVAVRYVAVLIIPAVMMTAFVGFRVESWWRWLRRKAPFLPRFIGKFAPWLLLWGCSAGALTMAIYNCRAGQHLYQKTYKIIREYKKSNPHAKVVVQRDDIERTAYYSKTALLPLKDNNKTEVKKYTRSVEANRPILFVIRDRKKYSRITFAPEELPPGAKWELYRRVKRTSGRESRNKELNAYIYTPPAKAVPCSKAPALASRKGNLVPNGGFEKSLEQKQALTLVPKSAVKESFYASPKFLLPAGGFRFSEGKRGELPSLIRSVGGKAALKGKTSLAVDPKANIVNVWFKRNLAPGKYTFEFLVKGKPGTIVEVVSAGGRGKKKTVRKHLYFKLPDEKLYRCSTTVAFDKLPFAAGIRIRENKACLDELFLAPVKVK